MQVIAYQIVESDDMLIVDGENLTVERQSKDGTIQWREMFIDKNRLMEYVEGFVKEGTIYGGVM